jgi:hypothetical protein
MTIGGIVITAALCFISFHVGHVYGTFRDH